MSYRLAIFDFDGTLADSFPFFISVFNQIADEHGFRRVGADEAQHLRHHDTRAIMRHVGMPAWKLPLASRSFIGLMRENAAHIPLFEGVGEALRELDREGVRLAIVSSNSEQNVRLVLGPQLSSLFGHYECGMSIFGKAGRIRKVVKRAEVAPGHALYVGDQAMDAEAARKAGVAFGAVSWGYAPIEALRRSGPEREFGTPAELLHILSPLRTPPA
ncbi:HAD hydrolase-like protein [Massilia sp. IC2-477]|uniref:HAD hydrolase-like protein n=1 Tax=Massilia sp. IC2-477 TaxID=2887198 RepID=UPI001D115203|nr:HAD hydrolase-like protein [Massilia sp. IC2-477]MCC2954702.1 HAD hydrolase-like protein [Massilia sp. IC2-477]